MKSSTAIIYPGEIRRRRLACNPETGTAKQRQAGISPKEFVGNL